MAIFTSIFAPGDFSEWTGVFGAPTVQAVLSHCGANAALSDTNNNEYSYVTYANEDDVYSRGYFRFSALPTNGNSVEIINHADTDVWVGLKLYNNAGQMQLGLYTGAWTYWNAAIVVDTWYCIKLKSERNVEVRGYLEGVSFGSLVYGDETTTGTYMGGWGKADNIDTYWDCVEVDTSDVACLGVSIPVAMHHYNHHINKIIRG